jgi:hypothetical protein
MQAALSAGPLAELQTAANQGQGSFVLQAALSAGSLAELQTAASRQLGSQGAL